MANKSDWQYQKSQELKYARQLRKVAEHSGAIVNAHINDDGELEDIATMMNSALLYSEALTPWANRVAAAMIASVSKSNERAWQKNSKIIGRGLSDLMKDSRIAPTLLRLQAEQVVLIKSLPTEAAERAQKLAIEAQTTGTRADEIAKQLQETTSVTKSRATLIARTEIAKSNANITQARAGLVGATQYIWRTMEDGAVRESHAEMANLTFDFDDPPEVGDEGPHGPGEFPNCRCYSEVVI
jgi:SPP1 gp7 family putative phage head morphogenesis protein